MPAERNSAIFSPRVSGVSEMQVRWATEVRPSSSEIICAIFAVAAELPEPPAE